MRVPALVIAAVILIGAAEPKQQFDLVCTGERKTALLAPGVPYSFRLHVDLVAGKWCEGECARIEPIAEAQPSVIHFEKESPDDKLLGNTRVRLVNRQSGKYIRHVNAYVGDRRLGVVHTIIVDATCEPRPFSGFPELERKF